MWNNAHDSRLLDVASLEVFWMKEIVCRLVLLLLLFALPSTAFAAFQAQQQSTAPDASAQVSRTSPSETGPAYVLPPDKLANAIALNRVNVRLHFIDAVWGIVVLLLLLQLGIIAKYRDWALSASRSRFLQGLIIFPLFFITTWLLSLPVDFYGQTVQLRYGLSVQSWGSYLGDSLKALAITIVLGTLILELVFLVIRRSPRRWWFYFWLLSLPMLVFGIFLEPVVIDPMFNHFEPLTRTNPALVADLERVVARGGLSIPPERMFLMRASDKVTTLNAYVTGIGASKRIVVWDTSIAKGTPDEIMFIFGHEMGHYVLDHIYKGLAFAALLFLAMLWLGYHAARWIIARFGAGWRIPDVSDYAAVAVLMLALSIFGVVSEPIMNTFSRHLEHQADIYGQEAMHGLLPNPQRSAQNAFQILGELSLDDPDPGEFTIFWMYSHPDIQTRANFARAYNPWTPNAQPKYFAK
ncbi:MAG TPA: M48 family metallopeptidase [Acidobacteriaceae bacterium]|nr:M48 family metallopeptidase [Acidobacteriaceae bacterium]